MDGKLTILVTGANGQLGMELRNLSADSGDRFIFTDVSQLPGLETVSLDITNKGAVAIVCESEGVDVIVNCAAYTNVDGAESDTPMAELLNNTAVRNLGEVAAAQGIAVIHISTDYVFSGEASVPYSETDSADPRGVYGSTKYAGEIALRESGCRYLIFRTSWLYSPYGKNFVKTMLDLTAVKSSVKVVRDQVGSPTYARDLAAVICKVLAERRFDLFAKEGSCDKGIYHYSNEGSVSWYDFAVSIERTASRLEKGDSERKCEIQPCTSSEYPSKVVRPPYSVLNTSRVKAALGVEIPYWETSLELCIRRILSD